MKYNPVEIIKKKKQGGIHTAEEIHYLVQEYTKNNIPDYQMAAWAMAVCFRGMNSSEIANFTEAMKNSGRVFDFSGLSAPRIDKHSTGGVGDKTSLIIGPLVASAGVFVPMIAGRGLGHTGGTLDKLESIPGFRIHLSREEFADYIRKHHFAIMGQTDDICPADKKLYALRDVTSTVDSLSLICGSIMSKKLAEDLTGLVLDVKFGSGAFMKTADEAIALAELLKSTGEENGIKVSALITNMNQPLGRYAGNSVEVLECLEILENKTCMHNGVDFYAQTRELSLQLSAHMLVLAERVQNVEAGYNLALQQLKSGAALRAFHDLLEYQGPADVRHLPQAKYSIEVYAPRSGYIQALQTEQIGMACVELRAGRKRADDKIDHAAGVEFFVQIGMQVNANEKLFRLFSNDEIDLKNAADIMQKAVVIGDQQAKAEQLILKVVT